MSWNQQQSYVPVSVSDERVTSFLAKVYLWMFGGLLVTAGTAFFLVSSPALIEAIVLNRILYLAILFAPIGLVLYAQARVDTISPATAAILFLIYSASVGVTVSLILLIYTATSVASTFIITAGMFGTMAVFGTVTKRSLAGVGQFMFMGLIGLILAMIVNIFWMNSALDFVISIVGIIVFTGLAAWKAQRMKEMAAALPDGRVNSYAIVGALSLYITFINLFFMLLRLTSGRRN